MACQPCRARREKMQALALEKSKKVEPQKKIGMFYKQSTDEEIKSDKIKVHGRLPVFCTVANHTCLDAVYRQCCVVEEQSPCDVSNCVFGTDAFKQILEEYDKKVEAERGIN